ncbi:MAG: redoxin family protein [Gemmatimonadetes bacterium]|nr:redoxin family protein [Gemmatimonadota bacterium]
MNWRGSFISVVVAAIVVAVLGYGLTRDPSQIISPLPGREAPDFTLALLDPTEAEDSVRLASLRGEVVVLNFWASWCLACRDEHRDLSEAATWYEGKGVRFYGVLYDDAPENGRRWIREMGGQTYPSIVDRNERTAIDYGLYGVPETFIIDANGRVVHKKVGPVTVTELRRMIDPLLATDPPAGS